jgi:hypothetical protein
MNGMHIVRPQRMASVERECAGTGETPTRANRHAMVSGNASTHLANTRVSNQCTARPKPMPIAHKDGRRSNHSLVAPLY